MTWILSKNRLGPHSFRTDLHTAHDRHHTIKPGTNLWPEPNTAEKSPVQVEDDEALLPASPGPSPDQSGELGCGRLGPAHFDESALDYDEALHIPVSRATYAEATRPVSESFTDSIQHTSNGATAPDFVLRYDGLSTQIQRLHPKEIFSILDRRPHLAGHRIAGVRWTTNGNLAVTLVHDENFVVEKVKSCAVVIFAILRHHVGDSEAIQIQAGGTWHSVVAHGAPIPSEDDGDSSTVEDWLRTGGVFPPVLIRQQGPPFGVLKVLDVGITRRVWRFLDGISQIKVA
ncbi:hypothetical protein R3P38DRAFT_2807897 [Favolaschia claudopus]|uniref:Uncharacterized protein n=1 Tax=Favolaschia claudopus TaxID=2862362 RepID=A0AAV9ZHL8_9AGAR